MSSFEQSSSVLQHPLPILARAIGDAVAWLSMRLHRHAAIRELERLGAAQAASIASDLGISVTHLRALATQAPGFPKQLKRILGALGIRDAVITSSDPRITGEMQVVCALCTCKRRCKKELAAGTAAANLDEFCPNAENLEFLRTGQQMRNWQAKNSQKDKVECRKPTF